MKIILDITAKPDGTFAPAWRIEGKAQLGVLLQAVDWLKVQLLAVEVGSIVESTAATVGAGEQAEGKVSK